MVKAAVVVELTHVATLHHDDVMDEAALRRGSSTANARWDNSVAILSGDWLFAQASDLVADLGPEAVRIQARTFGRLVEGQIRETLGVGEGQDPLKHYLSVVADKTGSLIATSVLFGARYAGASEEIQESLRAFGEEIGVAFQLADDILDIASESGQSGKTGTDLREGVPTLPVLIFRAQADPTDPTDARLLELLESDLSDDARLAETLDLLRPPGVPSGRGRRTPSPPTPANSSRPSLQAPPGTPSTPSATWSPPARSRRGHVAASSVDGRRVVDVVGEPAGPDGSDPGDRLRSAWTDPARGSRPMATSCVPVVERGDRSPLVEAGDRVELRVVDTQVFRPQLPPQCPRQLGGLTAQVSSLSFVQDLRLKLSEPQVSHSSSMMQAFAWT